MSILLISFGTVQIVLTLSLRNCNNRKTSLETNVFFLFVFFLSCLFNIFQVVSSQAAEATFMQIEKAK